MGGWGKWQDEPRFNPEQAGGLAANSERLLDESLPARVIHSLAKPVLSLEIPYVEGTTLRDYCRIITEESDHFNTAQAELRAHLLAATQEAPAALTARLQNEIHKSVLRIEREMRSVRRRNSVEAAGAGVGVALATLWYFNNQDLYQYLQHLGTTGGIYTLLRSYDAVKSNSEKPKTSNHYFFWLLSRKK